MSLSNKHLKQKQFLTGASDVVMLARALDADVGAYARKARLGAYARIQALPMIGLSQQR